MRGVTEKAHHDDGADDEHRHARKHDRELRAVAVLRVVLRGMIRRREAVLPRRGHRDREAQCQQREYDLQNAMGQAEDQEKGMAHLQHEPAHDQVGRGNLQHASLPERCEE